ncbi:hypothetical protein CLIB1444_03S06810 [[Candida] jaroonii]|uniref:Uncharacterized protein n=1 Tax=[Candida] jaroonii TaxID=467808 RepID=A0ACA9Y5F5_9ASCO|nr:hypothetical protein CLIB1444_03S06810 [[Candida] jaroonii]
MLDNLPVELIEKIVSHVDKSSLVNLNLVNKKYNYLVNPKLYNYIEVNCDNVRSSDEFILISNIYSLKSLFKKLNHKNCQYVYKLIFKNLPDLPEDEIFQYFKHIFPYFVNLMELKWYSKYNLDWQLINLLPSTKLCILNGNFKNFQLLDYKFNNICSLSLSGFKNFNNVDIDLINFPHLSKLKISKNTLVHVEDPLVNVFNNTNKLKLSNLTLENLYLTSSDVMILMDKIDFPSITDIKLLNIYEILNHNNLLDNFIPHKLNSLHMDMLNNEYNNHYIFNFLQQTSIDELKITINLNNNLQSNLISLLSILDAKISHLDLNFNIFSHNKASILNYLNPIQLLKIIENFQYLQSLSMPLFYKNLNHLNLNLPRLNNLQFNIIDIYKLNNTLINYETTNDISIHVFNHILRSVGHLDYLTLKLEQYHVFDVNSQIIRVVNSI